MTIKKTGLVILDPLCRVLILKKAKTWELPLLESESISETLARLQGQFVDQQFVDGQHTRESDKLNLRVVYASSYSTYLEEYCLLKDARFATLEELWHLVSLEDSQIAGIRKLVEKVKD